MLYAYISILKITKHAKKKNMLLNEEKISQSKHTQNQILELTGKSMQTIIITILNIQDFSLHLQNLQHFTTQEVKLNVCKFF